MSVNAFAAHSPTNPLASFTLRRRDPGPRDVQIEILHCGVCHSDIHMARNEWGITAYPVVPGHEIVGRVTAVGRDVRRLKPGDLAGVGVLSDSCRTCPSCGEGLEQYCETGFTMTYGSPDRHLGGMTQGGYSSSIVVDEHFALRISAKVNLAATAPLLCAGITTYSPLRHWKVGKGKKVGVVGLGGLGHMAVKLAHAMEAETVLFTTSQSKVADGLRLGADQVALSTDTDQMKKHISSFDLILDTVSASHNLDDYLNLLRRDGTLVLLGLPSTSHPSPGAAGLVFKRRQIAGSVIGSQGETQEMLDFCAERGIACDIEPIAIQDINQAYERMLRNDVKYRFVIDMSSLKAS